MSATLVADTASGLSATTLFLSLLIPAVALYYAYYKIKNRRFNELAEKIPGPATLPIFGNALSFRGSAHSNFAKLYALRDQYDNIARFWIGNRLMILIADPNDIEVILGSQVHLDKAPEYRFFKPWLGDGLLISSGQHWRSHRKLIAPTFHLNVLKSFMSLFNRNARDTCFKMASLKGKEFDVHDYMSECTVEILLVLQLSIWSGCSANKVPLDSDKELIMFEFQPISGDERTKRQTQQDQGFGAYRQSPAVPTEYLNLLQQLTPRQHAQQHQQIQQLVVARDGSKQPAAARYVLSHDGRIVQEGLPAGASPQHVTPEPQHYIQLPQQQTDPVTGRPIISPELEAFSLAQMQIQQEYHDAPLRAQIAGITERPVLTDPRVHSIPAGPRSPGPQVFSQAASQALARHEARIRNQLQDPAYAQYQIQNDPTYYQQLAQSIQQQQQQQQSVASVDTGRQLTSLYDQAPRQRVVYQVAQSQPQDQPTYTPKQPAPPSRRPIGASSHAQLAPSSQPQLLQSPQSANPHQFLVETTRPSSAPQQSHVRYVDTLNQQEPADPQSDALFASLFANGGRGLFSPAAVDNSGRSSLYTSRPQASPKAAAPAPQQLPTVRIPTSPSQRPLTRVELDALVNAGFSITPVGSEEPQASFLKSKRAPVPLQRRNHVVYQNEQDGVSYQYSPGSSEYNPSPKSKRYAPKHDLNNLYKADSANSGVVSYVLALKN